MSLINRTVARGDRGGRGVAANGKEGACIYCVSTTRHMVKDSCSVNEPFCS